MTRRCRQSTQKCWQRSMTKYLRPTLPALLRAAVLHPQDTERTLSQPCTLTCHGRCIRLQVKRRGKSRGEIEAELTKELKKANKLVKATKKQLKAAKKNS